MSREERKLQDAIAMFAKLEKKELQISPTKRPKKAHPGSPGIAAPTSATDGDEKPSLCTRRGFRAHIAKPANLDITAIMDYDYDSDTSCLLSSTGSPCPTPLLLEGSTMGLIRGGKKLWAKRYMEEQNRKIEKVDVTTIDQDTVKCEMAADEAEVGNEKMLHVYEAMEAE